jgi:hypothetical protein
MVVLMCGVLFVSLCLTWCVFGTCLVWWFWGVGPRDGEDVESPEEDLVVVLKVRCYFLLVSFFLSLVFCLFFGGGGSEFGPGKFRAACSGSVRVPADLCVTPCSYYTPLCPC